MLASTPCDEEIRQQANALTMCNLALTIQRRTQGILMPDGRPLQLRCGLHSGMVSVGMMAARIKLAGDTINTAKRVESACSTGAVNMSEQTYGLLPDYMRRLCTRHVAVVKSKGEMAMYTLSEAAAASAERQAEK